MIYLVADTHFDHKNIIKYCNRPFNSVREMNNSLIKNWNNTVRPNDTVFFLGDWSSGKNSRAAEYWIKQLNGNIITIRGSHDEGYENSQVINCGYLKFLLIHDPEAVSKNWNGWVIHGHKHNNDLARYPFINGDKKTINVSAEVIGYKPLELSRLLSLDIDTITRMNTIYSRAVRTSASNVPLVKSNRPVVKSNRPDRIYQQVVIARG